MITEVLGLCGCLRLVQFRYAPSGPREAFDAFFGVPVQFEAERTALVLHADCLDRPTRQANLQLFAFAEQYFAQALQRLRQDTTADPLTPLREAVVENAARGEYGAAAAARRAGLSLRAAQRLAQNHGQSLSGLIDEVRASSAKVFLKDANVEIETVAALVGYSDDRAFRRAFRRWTGQTPSEYRRSVV